MALNGIRDEVRRQCLVRDNYQCQNPKCKFRKKRHWNEELGLWVQNKLHLHHCIFKSRYRGRDRDEEWNLFNLCGWCHDLLHKPALSEVKESKELENLCIETALRRRMEAGLPEIDYSEKHFKASTAKKNQPKAYKTYMRDKYIYEKKRFMSKNQGLTPMQVAYRRKKGLRR